MLQKVRTLGSSSTRRSFLRTGLAAPGAIGAALIADRQQPERVVGFFSTYRRYTA